MSNMSYCRFRNTLEDLRDCFENWEDLDKLDEDEIPDKGELRARDRLLSLCEDIVRCYSEE